MANDSQTATTLLRYQVDNSSVQTAVLANTKVLESIQAVGAGTQTVAQQMVAAGASAQEIFDLTGESIATGVTAPIDAADASVKTLIRDIGDLGHDIEAIPEPDLSAFGVDESGGGGGASPFAQRRGLQSLGSLAGGQIGGGLGDAARLVSVGAAFGPLGVAAGIAAIAIKGVTDAEAAATEKAKVFVTNFGAVTDLLAKGATTGDLQKNIDELEHRNASLQKEQDLLKQLQKQGREADASLLDFNSDAGYLGGVLRTVNGSIAELTGDASQNFRDIGPVIDQLGTDIQDGKTKAATFRIELHSTTAELNNAAEAAHKLALAQESSADKALEVDRLTTKQRDERTAQDERDINVLTRLVGAGKLNDESLRNVAGRIDVLNADLNTLNGVSETYADVLEREKAAKDALTKQDQTYLDTLASEGKIRDAITDDLSKISDLRTEANAKEADNAAASADKIIEIDANAADKRAEIAANSADAIAKIERDAGRTERNAIGNRDAVALTQAQIKEKDALDDQAKSNAKALTQLDTSLKKQEATERASLDRQQRQLETSLNTQTQIANRKLLQDQTDLINVTNAELAISQNGGIGIVSAHEYMLQGIESTVLSYGVRIVSGLNNILSSYQPLPPAQSSVATQQPRIYTRAQIDSIFHQNLSNLIGMRQGGS